MSKIILKLKLMFLPILFMSTLISISSLSWFTIWIGLEINLMSFIPLMINKKKNFSFIKYFIFQSISSTSILIFSFSLMNLNFLNKLKLWISTMIYLSIIMKLGMPPFMNWFINIMNNLTWMNCLLLMTWQKIIPMFMMNLILTNKLLLKLNLILMMISSIYSAIISINLNSLKNLLSFSSINHMSWILLMMNMNFKFSILYFMLYSFITMTLIFFLIYNKINFLSELISLKKMSKNLLMNLFFIMMSMSGLPPSLGFFIKLTLILNMTKINFIIFSVMLISSSIMMFNYTRMLISNSMFFSIKYKNSIKKKKIKLFKYYSSWMNITNFLILNLILNLI
uniref:NADH-ubiquinone oxidoreductase chain 2 n=1 Tax=Helorus sp. ZJUH_2016017 TaxID=2491159 RepID=A0A3S8V0S0_9HYME|nr:NADH dehydrogenase subunit 2 [Helorus sp. ZJUH_2016017]